MEPSPSVEPPQLEDPLEELSKEEFVHLGILFVTPQIEDHEELLRKEVQGEDDI